MSPVMIPASGELAGRKPEPLLPCPFCGESEELYPSFEWPGNGPCVGIDCLGCGIEFKPQKGKNVFEAWNMRPVRVEGLA